MNRVLLFIDDYSELMFVQIILKKLGFDVDTLQNAHTLGDRLLSFRPNLMILTAESRKFSSDALLKQAMDQKSDLRFILLGKNSFETEKTFETVFYITSPVKPMDLIRATAESCHLPAEGLVEKFKKFRGQLNLTDEQQQHWDIHENQNEEPQKNEPQKNETYEQYLQSRKVKVSSTFDPDEVQKSVKTTRKSDASDQDIDGDRRAFTVELFKKSKP